jgi:Ser/Thr protein kinase RdoA (MazF antagonist)
LKVSEPVPRRDGKYLTLVTIPDVPPDRRCILFRWIPGRPLEEQLSPEKYFELGRSMTKLHQHARSLNPLPASIDPKRWNKVFYYPDEPVVYNTPEYSHLFSVEEIKLVDRVVGVANKVLRRLYEDQEGLILIHGDLHFWNVHYYRGELYLLDFEDINLGYPIQDIAVTLYYGRSREGYEELRDAFYEGYTSLQDWPEDAEKIIPVLWIARTVMFMNYVAWLWDDPTEFITERMKDVREFLSEETGSSLRSGPG